MKAIVYLRLSVLREDDPTLSPATQEKAARAYCDQQGWPVVEVVSDLDESGSAKGRRLDRPGLRKAITAIENGEADVLVASRLDRIARNVSDGLALSDSIKVATPQLGLLGGSAAGDFTRTLMLALAEMESTQISERVSAGVATARASGRWTSARVPYGYTTRKGDDGGTYLTPDPDERAIVREMADCFNAGDSINSIVTWLNETVPTKMGGKWRWQTVHNILTSPLTLRGWSEHRGNLVRDNDGQPLQITEPLLTDKQATRIEEWQRTKRTKPRKPGRPSSHWCASMARCRSCGNRMHIHRHISGRERAKVTDLMCSAPAGACPRRRTIRLRRYETEVEAAILDHLGELDWIKFETIDTASDAAEQRARADAVVADLARRMTLPGADVMALATELAAAKEAAETAEAGSVFITPVAMGDTIVDAWPTMSETDKAELLAAHAERITVGSDPRVEVDWKTEQD